MMSPQINELAAALAKAQGATQNAFMNRVNPHFKSKYADLSSVLDAIRAPLSANGLSIAQTMFTNEFGSFLQTTLMHSSGQFITSEYPLPGHGAKAHEIGSALTYGRRYSIAAMICNSADEDDDGDVAMTTSPSVKITKEQLSDIRDIADDVGADVEKLCKFFKVPSLADITTEMMPKVIAALEAKRVK